MLIHSSSNLSGIDWPMNYDDRRVGVLINSANNGGPIYTGGVSWSVEQPLITNQSLNYNTTHL